MPPLVSPALESYVKSGYMAVNLALRTANVRGNMIDKVAAIDAELRAIPASEARTVYRYGGPLTDFKGISLKPLDEFRDLAYLSTSTDIGIFERFGKKTGKVYFTISLLDAATTQGHNVSLVQGAKAKESEILFERGTPFKITGFSNSWHTSGIFVTLQELFCI